MTSLPQRQFFYVDLRGNTAGPVTAEELRSLRAADLIVDETFVVLQGDANWVSFWQALHEGILADLPSQSPLPASPAFPPPPPADASPPPHSPKAEPSASPEPVSSLKPSPESSAQAPATLAEKPLTLIFREPSPEPKANRALPVLIPPVRAPAPVAEPETPPATPRQEPAKPGEDTAPEEEAGARQAPRRTFVWAGAGMAAILAAVVGLAVLRMLPGPPVADETLEANARLVDVVGRPMTFSNRSVQQQQGGVWRTVYIVQVSGPKGSGQVYAEKQGLGESVQLVKFELLLPNGQTVPLQD